jgi:ABC-type uncharacterized transport systems, ATPase components
VLLHIEDLEVLDERGLEAVRGVSLDVRAGEIVAIAGVDGNGQTHLIDAITGLAKPVAGSIVVDGEELAGHSAHSFLDHGVGHIPEDRQRRGLVLEFSLAENLILHDYAKEPYSSRAFLHLKLIACVGAAAPQGVRRARRHRGDARILHSRAATSRRSSSRERSRETRRC